MGKLRSLIAFDGGTPLFFGEGGSGSKSATHFVAAVLNSSGSHEVWAWGNNTYGQLGNGTATSAYSPVKATWTPAAGEQIQEIATGERHTLMRTYDGTTTKVYGWGSNSYGQVGGASMSVSSTAKQLTPTVIASLTSANIVSIAAGEFHSIAADASGAVWVWGRDDDAYGNIGLPGTRTRYLPEKITSTNVDKKLATITSYSISNNVASVNTSSYHYFEAGETASVSTGIAVLDGSKAITSVSNTKFTYQAQANVASTSDSAGTVAFNSPSLSATSKYVSSNTAVVTVGAGHNFRAGNVVDVAIGDVAFDGQRTLTSVSGTAVAFQSQPNVSSQSTSGTVTYGTTSVSVTYKKILNNVGYLYMTSHNFKVGNRVMVSIGDAAFDGERVITGGGAGYVTFAAQANVGSTAVSPSGSAAMSSPSTAVVTNRVMSAPVGGVSTATLTVPVGHNFKVGNKIVVDITGTSEADFDGTWDITAVASTTVAFQRTGLSSSVASGATTGSIAIANSSWSVTNKAITANVARITVGASHGLGVGNVITISGVGSGFDGSRTLTGKGSDWVEFESQADVSYVATSGTIVPKDASFSVTAASITSNTVTATVTSGHDLQIGNVVSVSSGLGGNYDGVKTITAIGASSISYDAQANITSTSTSGTVAMHTTSKSSVSKSITSNVATVNVGAGHTFVVGNSVTVSGLGGNFDGVKSITAVAASTVSYTAQANVTSVAVSGTAEVDTCGASCPAVPSAIVEVAAGYGFSMARTVSAVYTWGYGSTNHYGRLGRSNVSTTSPSAITLPAACVPAALTTAPYNGAVTCADDRVVTWGINTVGNLGTNTAVATTSSSTPTAISGLTMNAGEHVSQVDLNHGGGIVRTSASRMYTWGTNLYRLLGNAKTYAASVAATTQPYSITAQLTTRVAPSGSASVTKVVSDYYTTVALDSNGKVWTYGTAAMGLTGRGVAGPTGTAGGARFYEIGLDTTARIAMIDVTYYGTVVVMSDGTVWTLGTYGESTATYYLGDSTSNQRYTVGRIDLPFGPDTTLSSVSVSQLACAYSHCLIATSNGSIYGWGDGLNRSIVVNSTADASTPTLIKSGLTNPRIAAGNGVSYYVDIGSNETGGTVYAWGSNGNRRGIPQAATNPLTTFTAVQDTIAPAVANNIVAISAGNAHVIALRADGTLMMWGSNSYGQLAIGSTATTTYFSEPVLPGGRVAVSLHATGSHTIVRATDGTLWGWGHNPSSVLVSGSATTVKTPTAVASGYRFSSIDTYGYGTTVSLGSVVGITTSGQVVAWGSNQFGQLGRSDRPNAASGVNAASATPVAVQTTVGGTFTNVDRVVAAGWWSGAWKLASSGSTPGAPTAFALSSPAASTLTASWTAPTSPPAIRGYVVEVSRGGSVVFRVGAGSSATSVTFASPDVDVLNGQAHSAVVFAVNEFGDGTASSSASATPVGVPGVPRNFDVAPIGGGLRVSWDTPTDLAGLPIIDYRVTATPTGGGSAVTFDYTVNTSSSASYTHDITSGLSSGTQYSVEVKARNTEGYGLSATAIQVVPGRPSAPEDVVALGLLASTQVTWAAPAHDGGAAVQSYVVKVYSTGTSTVVGSAVVTSGLTSTISSLTNGTTYDVTVTASQAADGLSLLGLESDRVEVVPGRPATPTGVSAAAANLPTGTKVRVTWNKVPDVSGITVSGYEIKHVLGAVSTSVAVAVSACGASTCTYDVPSLTNGSEYTFSVRAKTSTASWGLYSSTVTATPIGATSAPTVAATPDDTTAAIAVGEPASLNGSAVTSYTASIALSSGGAAIETVTLDPTDATYTFQNLTNGTSYRVSVMATNEAGESAAGTATVVPATNAGAPTNVRARPGSIIVTWDAPASTGGATITEYMITVTSEDGFQSDYLASSATNSATTSGCSVAGRTCTILKVITSDSDGLYVDIPADVTYTVEIVAVNSAGNSPPSEATVLVSAQPDAPTSVVATAGIEKFDLCWTEPALPTGATSITAYKINATVGSSIYSYVTSTLSNPTGCVAPSVGLTVTSWDDGTSVIADTTYSVTVQATVSASDYVFGVESSTVSVTPYGLPGAPTITGASTTASTATITWSAANPRGSAVTLYTVTAAPSGDTCTWSSGPLTCTLLNLTGDATYSVTVTATNAAGEGSASAPLSVLVDATPPTPAWAAPAIGPSRRAAYTATFDEAVYYRVTFDETATGFTTADLSNAGTATGCVYGISVVTVNRVFDISVTCSSDGTLISQVAAAAATDASQNNGPALNVNAALVTLYDPITTTTTTTTTTSTTTTTVAAASTSTTTTTSTTTSAPGASSGTTTTAVSGTTTTILGAGGGSVPGDGGSSSAGATTTVPNAPGATTSTTIGSNNGGSVDDPVDDLPKERLTDDKTPSLGEKIPVRGGGFKPGEIVEIIIGGKKVAEVRADKNGIVDTTIEVPTGLPTGPATLSLYAPGSGRGSRMILVLTGSNAQRRVALSVAAILLGFGLLRIRRRRTV